VENIIRCDRGLAVGRKPQAADGAAERSAGVTRNGWRAGRSRAHDLPVVPAPPAILHSVFLCKPPSGRSKTLQPGSESTSRGARSNGETLFANFSSPRYSGERGWKGRSRQRRTAPSLQLPAPLPPGRGVQKVNLPPASSSMPVSTCAQRRNWGGAPARGQGTSHARASRPGAASRRFP